MDSTIIAEDIPTEANTSDAAAVSPNPLRCPPPPLHQISPERLNQQRIPQSPSLHGFLVENDRPRTRDSMASDVQTKIALLNSLAGTTSVQSSPTRAGRGTGAPGPNMNAGAGVIGGAVFGGNPAATGVNNSNALQRAVMGYEEAQASLATMTAELERAREELASRKKRERLLSQRVEDLLEELQAEKEKRARDQESYAKEIKRCRKEAYRADLAVVESRQDLKEVRAELKRCQSEVQHERAEKEKSRQESFERAYALAGTVGEVEQLKDQLKVVEKERDAALLEIKANAVEKSDMLEKQDAVARQRTQSDDALSWSPKNEGETRLPSNHETLAPMQVEERLRTGAPADPRFDSIKFRLDYFEKKMEGLPVTPQEEIRFLKEELRCARRQHVEDAGTIHFMHMQCQFKACPCRLAEAKGERFVHDHEYDARLQQERSMKKRKISIEPSQTSPTVQEPGEEKDAQPKAYSKVSAQDRPGAAPEKRQSIALPPEPMPERLSGSGALGEPSILEEALEIPLPEPLPMELDARDETPERTAQLEDITQVLVEPGTVSKPFSFSTSTTSNPSSRARAPPLQHTESAAATLEHDLFDLSPPKPAPPRRPSTAMGILTVDSPIRLVPDSPRSVRASRHRIARSTTPAYGRDQDPTQLMTTTTKVALKGSPSRDSLHRRAQSRPNLPSQSPLASSVMSQLDDDDGGFTKETSASPAPNTLFPVTPLHKHSRSMHNLAQHHQTHAQTETDGCTRTWNPPQTIATTTTTTRVPLRGFEDADDIYSPERNHHANTHRNDYEHAHTEVLNVNLDMTALNTNVRAQDTNMTTVMRPLQPSSTSILGNIPGTPISREAALAQIRARRDRARSINLKRSTDGTGNGNAVKGVSKSPTKPKAVNGIPGGVGGLFARDKENAYGKREISQASAPGRFAY